MKKKISYLWHMFNQKSKDMRTESLKENGKNVYVFYWSDDLMEYFQSNVDFEINRAMIEARGKEIVLEHQFVELRTIARYYRIKEKERRCLKCTDAEEEE